ncbi:MAG: hypothetical protein AAF961_20055, partial [Planctomycetota bacterium]
MVYLLIVLGLLAASSAAERTCTATLLSGEMCRGRLVDWGGDEWALATEDGLRKIALADVVHFRWRDDEQTSVDSVGHEEVFV